MSLSNHPMNSSGSVLIPASFLFPVELSLLRINRLYWVKRWMKKVQGGILRGEEPGLARSQPKRMQAEGHIRTLGGLLQAKGKGGQKGREKASACKGCSSCWSPWHPWAAQSYPQQSTSSGHITHSLQSSAWRGKGIMAREYVL